MPIGSPLHLLDIFLVGKGCLEFVIRRFRRHRHSKAFKAQDALLTSKIEVANWPMSKVYLVNDSNFPWLMLVPKQNNLREFTDLHEEDQIQVFKEINRATTYLQKNSQSLFGFKPFKMNVGQLGCVVQQLHVHVLARNEGDVCWPGPVWGQAKAVPYSQPRLDPLVSKLKEKLHWSLAADLC